MRSAAERKWFTGAQGPGGAAEALQTQEISVCSGFCAGGGSDDPGNCWPCRNHALQFGQIDKNRHNRIHRAQTLARYGRPRRQKERPDGSSTRPISARMVW
jgi:hypothetical protein